MSVLDKEKEALLMVEGLSFSVDKLSESEVLLCFTSRRHGEIRAIRLATSEPNKLLAFVQMLADQWEHE